MRRDRTVKEQESMNAVKDVLEREAAKLGEDSPVGRIWRDWAELLAGQPSPFALPWQQIAG